MSLNVEKVREDFTVLSRQIHKKPIIYMDSACMSLKPKQVVNAINEYYNEYPACAGRSAHHLAKQVENKVHDSRKEIQKFIGAKKQEEIIFTRNTSESMNFVAHSLGFRKNDAVLTSDKEHNSGLLPFQILRNIGVNHDTFTFADSEDFKKKLTKNTKLVSFVATSNVDGTSQNIKELTKIAHDNKTSDGNNTLVLIDGAQHVPHEKTDVRKLNCDFLAFSGHKMCGPTGTGILYGKFDVLKKIHPIQPFMIGGETVKNTTHDSYEIEDIPMRFEAGLQDYAGIIGLSEGCKYLQKIGLDNIKKHEEKLNLHVTSEFEKIGNINIIGPKDAKKRAGIVSFTIKNTDYQEVAALLNETSNIMVRSGMHCVHSWFNKHKLPGSVRASLYLYNTKEECDVLVNEIKNIKKILC